MQKSANFTKSKPINHYVTELLLNLTNIHIISILFESLSISNALINLNEDDFKTE